MESTKTSTTAYIITACVTGVGQIKPWSQYLSPKTEFLNRAFFLGAADTLFKKIIKKLPPSILIRIIDSVFVPGFALHCLFRKIFIEEQASLRLNNNIKQVIILGAGFDTLALRLAEDFPLVNFYEIDQQATQSLKRSILEKMDYKVPPNCRFIPADLSVTKLHTFVDKKDGFDRLKDTLVVLEGVLMFLDEASVKSLFTDLHELFSNLTIIFGAIVKPDDAGNWSLRLVNSFLGKINEKTKWSCPSKDMEGFLKELGYNLEESKKYKDLQRRFRPETEISDLPDEDENYYIAVKTA